MIVLFLPLKAVTVAVTLSGGVAGPVGTAICELPPPTSASLHADFAWAVVVAAVN
jgi:hypothetical protein